jgi:hypothetical protein
MSDQKYVCIDLDGTIAHYDDWKGEKHFGEPVEGAQEALKRIHTAGWKIIIFTTRANKKLVSKYLNSHAIPYDAINENPDQPPNTNNGKPYADAYVDDRGIKFNGDWEATTDEVLQFVPWEKRKKPDQEEEYRKEAINFLGRDYDQAFDQLRAYDTQIWEILKYSFGQLVGSIAAVWVIFSFANGDPKNPILSNLWKPVDATILVISFLFGLLALQLILRNRGYFAETARYINEQRSFFLSSRPMGFKNLTHYYTDYSRPRRFDAGSTQVLYIYVIAFIGSILLGLGGGLYGFYFGLAGSFCVVLGVAVWLAACIGTIWYALDYLNRKKKEHPNLAPYGMIDMKDDPRAK